MATEAPTTRILHELDRTLEILNADLNRLEVLTGALVGFARPVPDYEPTFCHLHGAELRRHELAAAVEKRSD